MKDEYGLSPRQKAFCNEYIHNGGNGAEAARQAGYSAKSANTKANQLLHVEAVYNYIHNFEQAEKAKTIMSNIDILKFWCDIANDAEQATGDRLRAIEDLAKAKMMFREQLSIEGNVSYIDILARARSRANKADKS